MIATRPVSVLLCTGMLILIASCYREEIQLPGDLDGSYTTIIRVDTVTPQISTVLIDSFVTGSATSFLLGGYTDPYLGTIEANAFMQIGLPEGDRALTEDAVFDSLVLIMRLNKYYYGDTTVPITIAVHELDENIVTGYDDQLYNNSRFSVKPATLGNASYRIRPGLYDSLELRLDHARGAEWFAKLKEEADEFANADNFLLYFKGIRLSVADADPAAVYGLSNRSGDIKIRLHYHTTTPFPEEKFLDFPALTNALAFRQILTHRNGTLPDPAVAGRHEFLSSETGHLGFTQSGTGVMMKVVFPGLRNVLSTDVPVSLLHAELVVRPQDQSFRTFSLPPSLQAAATNETNLVGNWLPDSSGQAVLSASPVIDFIYGANNYYRYNVTTYVNELLHTPASEGTGFFLMENTPEGDTTLNRAVFEDASHPKNRMLLVLSLLTVNTK